MINQTALNQQHKLVSPTVSNTSTILSNVSYAVNPKCVSGPSSHSTHRVSVPRNKNIDSFNKFKLFSLLKDGPFVWDKKIQGLILSAYFYGYIFLQVIKI